MSHQIGWTPLLLCQDFIGHRTHADLLEKYLSEDDECRAGVTRFSVNDYGEVARTILRAAGYRLPLTGVRSRELDLWHWRSFMIQGYLANRAIQQLSGDPDIAYVHSHSAGRVVHSLSKSVPVIVSLDGTVRAESRMTIGKTPLFDQPATRLERSIFDRADLVVAFSDWARASVVNDYGVPEEKTCTIRNAVEPIATALDSSAWRPGTDLPIIGFVGNGFKRKGGDLLLKAHQQYLSERSHLVIVTKDNVPTEGLKNVTVLGPMPRAQLLASVLPLFAVYAHPARQDWSPYSVIEALAACLPVVAANVGSLPEMVTDGVNGYLVDRPTPAILAEAILSILDDSSLATQMGRASQAIYQERYSADRNYPELIQTLKSRSRTGLR